MPVSSSRAPSVAEATEELTTPTDDIIVPEDEPRNFRLIVVNGIMTAGPLMFFDPNTVIAAFIIHAHGSQALVGLVNALMMLGFVGPQFFVANWIETKPTKLFVYQACAFFRLGSLSLAALLMWVFRDSIGLWFVYVLLALLTVYWSAGGFGAVAWYEVLSKTVRSARRPVIFAWRQTGAGLVALGAGIVVTWALSDRSGMEFPVNYLFLLVVMTVGMAVGITAFTFVREPADHKTPLTRRPWGEYFRLGPRIMRDDHNYRRLVLGQIAFSLAVMITPFLIPFIIKEIEADDSVIGVLMALAAGTDLIVNIYWGRLGSRKGNRAVLVVGSKVAALSPIAALSAVFATETDVLGVDLRIVLIAVSLIMSRVANSGIWVGRMNYLLDIAPQVIRPSYVGFMNTMSLLPLLMPVVAGNVIDAVGYTPVFALAAVFGIVSIAIIAKLDDVRNGVQAPVAGQ